MDYCEFSPPRICLACDRLKAENDYACDRCGRLKARLPAAFWEEVRRRANPAWIARIPSWRRTIEARLHPAVRARLESEHLDVSLTAKEGGVLGLYETLGPGRHRIHLWSRLGEPEAETTFAHEYAHFVAGQVFGSRGHDMPWRRVLWVLGRRPRTYRHLYRFSWRRWRRWQSPDLDQPPAPRPDAPVRDFRVGRPPFAAVLDGDELERLCDWYAGHPEQRPEARAILSDLSEQAVKVRLAAGRARVHLPARHVLEAASWYAGLGAGVTEPADRLLHSRLSVIRKEATLESA